MAKKKPATKPTPRLSPPGAFPPPTDRVGAPEPDTPETAAKRAQYEWGDGVLKTCGLMDAVELAKTRDELEAIKLDKDDPDVVLAVRDALSPVGRQPDEHFRGLK